MASCGHHPPVSPWSLLIHGFGFAAPESGGYVSRLIVIPAHGLTPTHPVPQAAQVSGGSSAPSAHRHSRNIHWMIHEQTGFLSLGVDIRFHFFGD